MKWAVLAILLAGVLLVTLSDNDGWNLVGAALIAIAIVGYLFWMFA